MSGLTDAAQNLLSQVQQLFGAGNVRVTSTSRTPTSNAALAGASKTSQHLTGNAFDFIVSGMSPAQVQSAIAQSGIAFGQSIQEYGAAAGTGANHLGVGTKGQLLTGNNGKYSTTGYASKIATQATVNAQKTVGDWLSGFGLGGLSNTLGTALAAPGDAIDGAVASVTPDFNAWFGRIAIGVFAVLLIAVGLFMLSAKPIGNIVEKIPPIVPV